MMEFERVIFMDNYFICDYSIGLGLGFAYDYDWTITLFERDLI